VETGAEGGGVGEGEPGAPGPGEEGCEAASAGPVVGRVGPKPDGGARVVGE
jgi:hypothetical protein